MQFCCSLPGASAPLDLTYSTVQEQQTGFSFRYNDTNMFYVCMHNSMHKKSSSILLQHVKLDLLQPLWRLSTARPNVQHGAGATNGIFNPIR